MAISTMLRNVVASKLQVAIFVMLLQAAIFVCGIQTTLKLKSSFPMNHGIELSKLRDRDTLRHRRILLKHSCQRGVLQSPIYGNYDQHLVG